METRTNERELPSEAQSDVRPPALGLTSEDWIDVARIMLTSRLMDHIEESELVPSGKVVYQASARGHELAQILLGFSLLHERDSAGVYYRSRPFALACGLDIEQAFASSMARAGSFNGGRDAGAIFALTPYRATGGPRRGRATVLPAVGDVGAQYSPAAGWAQAIVFRQRVLGHREWSGAMAVALGGDGSIASNGFWAALNIVTTQGLPYLFFIEDNGYSISVPSVIQTPGGNIAENLASYKNLTIVEGDGADPIDAAEKIERATTLARSGAPCLLRLSVPRLQGHSPYDSQTYKSVELRQREAARDPLPRLRRYLEEAGILSAEAWATLESDTNKATIAARDAAMAQPHPDPSTTRRYLFHDPQYPQMIGGLLDGQPVAISNSNAPPDPFSNQGPMSRRGPMSMRGPESMSPLTLNAAIKRTLESELRLNPRMVIFGEDVGPMGGLYGTTTSLQTRFGVERVFDTSLSEEGILGRAVGMSLAGLLPVPEIQARKYVEAAGDQLSNCGSMRWRTAGKFAAPMVIRMPCGCGPKAGDPFHAITSEGMFAHSPGLRVAFPSNAEDAVGLLRAALRGNDPTIFLEHRTLLYAPSARRYYPGDEHIVLFGEAKTLQDGDELTIVTWGETVFRCLAAADDYKRRVEVIDLRTIVPWDKEAVLRSIRRTHRCLIVHEDTVTCGFGAEIAATIAQEAFMDLEAPVIRLGTLDNPVPYSSVLHGAVAPTPEKIRAQIANLLSY